MLKNYTCSDLNYVNNMNKMIPLPAE